MLQVFVVLIVDRYIEIAENRNEIIMLEKQCLLTPMYPSLKKVKKKYTHNDRRKQYINMF